MYLVRCPSCDGESKMQAGQFKAGYTAECTACSILTRNKKNEKVTNENELHIPQW